MKAIFDNKRERRVLQMTTRTVGSEAASDMFAVGDSESFAFVLFGPSTGSITVRMIAPLVQTEGAAEERAQVAVYSVDHDFTDGPLTLSDTDSPFLLLGVEITVVTEIDTDLYVNLMRSKN
jgi:hypothetical protein